MTKKKTQVDQFAELTWNDLKNWAGNKIVSRGKSYQQQGLVSELAITCDGGLIAWVEGTHCYAAEVVIHDDGLLASFCTCPYEFDCKHAVAMVVEYLEMYKNNQKVPEVKPGDERLRLLVSEAVSYDDGPDNDVLESEAEFFDDDLDNDDDDKSGDTHPQIEKYLKKKTKDDLIQLIKEFTKRYPEIAQEILDRNQLTSGNIKTLVKRLRIEIYEIGSKPGWCDHWRDEGFIPDYSGIRGNLQNVLDAGFADEVLTLGEELISTGIAQVEMSHDQGQTAEEIAECMPVIVEALDRSSLDPADKLNWALDILLKDQFEICNKFGEYLHRRHPVSAWHPLADNLLARLDGEVNDAANVGRYMRDYARDQLCDWAIHALEGAGREDEIILLCEAEAVITESYVRLVRWLVKMNRYQEAEEWIHKGLAVLNEEWPGTDLREQLREIRVLEKRWPEVAAIQAEEFVRKPSRIVFTDCKKACVKVKAWPTVRQGLLDYLETGKLPWHGEDWPLPETGLDTPKAERRDPFPLINDLIDIAILENKPDQVLRWYDQHQEKGSRWFGVSDDEIAKAVQTHAPDRAVDIWKNIAHRLIAQVKPSAYQEAARYLRKAAKVMISQEKQLEWKQYLAGLRIIHQRKRRLIEVLDDLEEKAIVRRKH